MQGCDSASRQPSLRWVGLRDELRLEFFFSGVTAAFQKDKNKYKKQKQKSC